MFKINFNAKLLLRFTPIIFNILPAFFVARFLGPKVFAEYNLIFVLVTLTTNIFISPFGSYLNKNTIQLHLSKNLTHNLFFFLIYNSIIYFLLSILFYLSGYLFFLNLSIHQYLFMFFGVLFLNPLLQTLLSVLNFLGNSLYYSFFTIGYSILTICSSLISINIYQTSVYFWVLGSTFAQLIALLLLIIIFLKFKYISLKSLNLKYFNTFFLSNILKFSFPLLLTNIILWIIFQSYKFQLPTLIGLHETGLFLAGYGLASIFASTLESVSNLIIWPALFKKNENFDLDYKYDINEYLKFILNTLFLIFVIIIIYGGLLIKLVLGSSFSASYDFLIFGFVIESIRVLINTVFIKFHINNNTKPIFHYHLFIAIIFYLFLFIFKDIINIYFIITILVFSLIVPLFYFLYIKSKNVIKFNLFYKYFLLSILLYFLSIQSGLPFVVSKYIFSFFIIFVLVSSNIKYLKKILTQNTEND